jgi:CheY-like chemotaxis protein
MENYEYAPPQKKVFLVENDSNVVVNFLKKFGQDIQVQVLGSPDEALELLNTSYAPDAVIISKYLGGLKFLEQIRNNAWTKTLPVIITSTDLNQGLIKEVVAKKEMMFLQVNSIKVIFWYV